MAGYSGEGAENLSLMFLGEGCAGKLDCRKVEATEKTAMTMNIPVKPMAGLSSCVSSAVKGEAAA